MFNITTAIIKSNNKYDNLSRLYLLKTVLQKLEENTSILVLPAGFLYYTKFSEDKLKSLKKEVIGLIQDYSPETIICLGIDANDGKDQLGLAINKNQIIAIGRKFYPTDSEKNIIEVAESANETEFKLERTFTLKGKNFFLAVCYDSFGIKHQKLKNPGIDFVIDLIHGFSPKGSGNSGEVYFAKHGMAGASKQWECPILSSAVFFNREIPERWPTAVMWNKGNISTQNWKYDYNPISALKTFELQITYESVQFRTYNI